MKTIEQAKKEYADSIVPLGGHDKYSAPFITAFERHENVDDAFKAGVEFAQRWIQVEEEMPEADDHSDPIEMKLKNGVIVSGYRFSDGDWLQHDEFGRGKIIKTKVTHWRPIELK